MANYYFLTTYLPALKIGEVPELSFNELDHLLKDNLRSHDLKKVEVIRKLFDLENARSLWKGGALDPRGLLDRQELEDVLAGHGTSLPYLTNYLEKYEKSEPRLKNFSEVLASYFREEIPKASGFLKHYLTFERLYRLSVLGFRAKMFKKDLISELQFEDPDDEVVAQILVQKDAPHFEPPEGFEALKGIFEEHREHPLELHKALIEWKFSKIDEMLEFDPFSIDRILGYLVQLILVENWQELDENIGLNLVKHIVKESK